MMKVLEVQATPQKDQKEIYRSEMKRNHLNCLVLSITNLKLEFLFYLVEDSQEIITRHHRK
jgi:hypothetical protein